MSAPRLIAVARLLQVSGRVSVAMPFGMVFFVALIFGLLPLLAYSRTGRALRRFAS